MADKDALAALNTDWCATMRVMSRMFDKMLGMTAAGSSSFTVSLHT